MHEVSLAVHPKLTMCTASEHLWRHHGFGMRLSALDRSGWLNQRQVLLMLASDLCDPRRLQAARLCHVEPNFAASSGTPRKLQQQAVCMLSSASLFQAQRTWIRLDKVVRKRSIKPTAWTVRPGSLA